jgi:hypothetical protein
MRAADQAGDLNNPVMHRFCQSSPRPYPHSSNKVSASASDLRRRWSIPSYTVL